MAIAIVLSPSAQVPSVHLAFGGDVMLGRNVENLIVENGAEYPFGEMRGILQASDYTIVNLEGPIRKNHIHTKTGEFGFSFNENTIEILKDAGINITTLGNNHGLDGGEHELLHTHRVLETADITPIGNPRNDDSTARAATIIADPMIVLLSYNATWPTTWNEELALSEITSYKNQGYIPIVLIHWGTEYDLHSSMWQRNLAHAFGNAGARIIIGHHPHVTQEIERHGDTIIFYSLGNLVFDQYFSRDVEEGLVVSLALSREDAVFTLTPIEGNHSRPRPMDTRASNDFLTRLAARSDQTLYNEIINGLITIEYARD